MKESVITRYFNINCLFSKMKYIKISLEISLIWWAFTISFDNGRTV